MREHATNFRVKETTNANKENDVALANILWTVLVVLVVIWLLGLVLGWAAGSPLIHLLLVIAAVILIYNLMVGRRTV